jgi:hypothetical protein
MATKKTGKVATQKTGEGTTGGKRDNLGERSLDEMIKTIGPYLPKRDFGVPAESSDWQITADVPWDRRQPKTHLVIDPG